MRFSHYSSLLLVMFDQATKPDQHFWEGRLSPTESSGNLQVAVWQAEKLLIKVWCINNLTTTGRV
jgi:hypothetical protein